MIAGPDSLLVVLALAIVLGLKHAADPDHLVAVSTLVATDADRPARRAAALGLGWGLGHAASVSAFGLPVVLFGPYLRRAVQAAAEALAGVLIALLGFGCSGAGADSAFTRTRTCTAALADGSCPPGKGRYGGSEMLHVWFTGKLRSAYRFTPPCRSSARRGSSRARCAGRAIRSTGCEAAAGPRKSRVSACLRRRDPVQKQEMFRLRNLVLLWIGRKLWAAVRPAVQRRLRKRSSPRS